MSYRDEFFSKETNLVSAAKRELANGLNKSPIHKIRLLCFSKGIRGLMDLARMLRKMDRDGDNLLNESEFIEALVCLDIIVDRNEAANMFHNNFKDNNEGLLNITEFIHKLRPQLRQSRLELIDKAFNKIDRDADDVITVEDLKHAYNVRDHPKYLSGELLEQEILMQFLRNFIPSSDYSCKSRAGNGFKDTATSERICKVKNSKITREDFVNYYIGVSASIENDAYFDLVMRRAYKF